MKVISISSFVAHEQVSLKLTLQYYGAIMLPIPSEVYSAPMNIEGANSTTVSIAPLLDSTLSICARKSERVFLHIGFLANISQANDIVEAIEKFTGIIAAVVVDPVMGDNGFAYGAKDKTSWFKQLLPYANLATPNFTELCMLTGCAFEASSYSIAMARFKQQFPNAILIVTSVPAQTSVKQEVGVGFYQNNQVSTINFARIGDHASGTGDLFTMGIIDHYFIRKKAVDEAIRSAHVLVSAHLSNTYKEKAETTVNK